MDGRALGGAPGHNHIHIPVCCMLPSQVLFTSVPMRPCVPCTMPMCRSSTTDHIYRADMEQALANGSLTHVITAYSREPGV